MTKSASSSSWGGSPTSFLTRNTCLLSFYSCVILFLHAHTVHSPHVILLTHQSCVALLMSSSSHDSCVALLTSSSSHHSCVALLMSSSSHDSCVALLMSSSILKSRFSCYPPRSTHVTLFTSPSSSQSPHIFLLVSTSSCHPQATSLVSLYITAI